MITLSRPNSIDNPVYGGESIELRFPRVAQRVTCTIRPWTSQIMTYGGANRSLVTLQARRDLYSAVTATVTAYYDGYPPDTETVYFEPKRQTKPVDPPPPPKPEPEPDPKPAPPPPVTIEDLREVLVCIENANLEIDLANVRLGEAKSHLRLLINRLAQN